RDDAGDLPPHGAGAARPHRPDAAAGARGCDWKLSRAVRLDGGWRDRGREPGGSPRARQEPARGPGESEGDLQALPGRRAGRPGRAAPPPARHAIVERLATLVEISGAPS